MSCAQAGHLVVWAVFLIAGELALFGARVPPPALFIGAAAGFSAGFALRVAGIYPGKPEPLALDFLSAVIAIGASCRASNAAGWTFAVLPLLVISPHLVYIFLNRDIEESGWFSLIRRQRCENRTGTDS